LTAAVTATTDSTPTCKPPTNPKVQIHVVLTGVIIVTTHHCSDRRGGEGTVGSVGGREEKRAGRGAQEVLDGHISKLFALGEGNPACRRRTVPPTTTTTATTASQPFIPTGRHQCRHRRGG
jgi:hypothetical protein